MVLPKKFISNPMINFYYSQELKLLDLIFPELILQKKIMTLRNLADMDNIIAKTNGLKNIAVVGGGFIGLEVVENLIAKGFNVTVIELGNQVMAKVDYEFAKMVQHQAAAKNLTILFNTSVEAFEEKGN